MAPPPGALRPPTAPYSSGGARSGETRATRVGQTGDEVSEAWDTVLEVVAVTTNKKFVLSAERRADCEAGRLLFLGSVGNEELQSKREKEEVFYEKSGKKEQILRLARAFRSMDMDGSGRIHLSEMRGFASKFDPGPFGALAARVEKFLLGKKSSFTL